MSGPCKQSLYPHIRRVNYRVAQWKRAHTPMVDIPPATSHEWVYSDGYTEPLWSEGPVLPSCLLDILAGVNEDDTSDDGLAGDDASDDGLEDADEWDYSSLDSDSDTD